MDKKQHTRLGTLQKRMTTLTKELTKTSAELATLHNACGKTVASAPPRSRKAKVVRKKGGRTDAASA